MVQVPDQHSEEQGGVHVPRPVLQTLPLSSSLQDSSPGSVGTSPQVWSNKNIFRTSPSPALLPRPWPGTSPGRRLPTLLAGLWPGFMLTPTESLPSEERFSMFISCTFYKINVSKISIQTLLLLTLFQAEFCPYTYIYSPRGQLIVVGETRNIVLQPVRDLLFILCPELNIYLNFL